MDVQKLYDKGYEWIIKPRSRNSIRINNTIYRPTGYKNFRSAATQPDDKKASSFFITTVFSLVLP